jgi:hypothetical protein
MKTFMMLLILIPVLSHSMENKKPAQEGTGRIVLSLDIDGLPSTDEHAYKGTCTRNGRDYTLSFCGGTFCGATLSVLIWAPLMATNTVSGGWGVLGMTLTETAILATSVAAQHLHYNRKERAFRPFNDVPPKHAEL